jgi:glutathione S-transferase
LQQWRLAPFDSSTSPQGHPEELTRQIPGKLGRKFLPQLLTAIVGLRSIPISYCLNAKSVPYQTEWVELPDVKATRIALGVPPVRKLPNGEDFYTLPIIHDTATDTYVGDSFDIAVYLDQKYPESGSRLFPGSIGVYRAFNAYVDALFTRYVALGVEGLPFNPETAEATKAEHVARFGVNSWDDFSVKGEARQKMLEAFKADMEELATFYRFDGPFLEGQTMTYADIIVGGWLSMLKVTLAEFYQIYEWQGGRWKRLHQALDQWAEIK